MKSAKGFGLTPGAFRPQSRWAVDNCGPEGYAETLPPEAAAYLERFNREYYGADSRALNAPDALHDAEQRRAIFRAQNCAARDLASLGRIQQDALAADVYDRVAIGRIPETE